MMGGYRPCRRFRLRRSSCRGRGCVLEPV